MKKYPVINFEQLKRGYKDVVENAVRFFGASTELCNKYPDKALALAQIGQEELGKSLTILAAFHLPQDSNAWQWFWGNWTSHQLKAHRAYLYELISPLRIEIQSASGDRYSGLPLRPKIHQEKESGLYVDFDLQAMEFISPLRAVSNLEAQARTSTLLYLNATADAVQRTLLFKDEFFRLPAFGEIAFRICSEKIYQQDMPRILEEFSSQSEQHEKLISDLNLALAANKNFFTELTTKNN